MQPTYIEIVPNDITGTSHTDVAMTENLSYDKNCVSCDTCDNKMTSPVTNLIENSYYDSSDVIDKPQQTEPVQNDNKMYQYAYGHFRLEGRKRAPPADDKQS